MVTTAAITIVTMATTNSRREVGASARTKKSNLNECVCVCERSMGCVGCVGVGWLPTIATVYLLIYRTLLITPDTLLGNFPCSSTTDTPVL